MNKDTTSDLPQQEVQSVPSSVADDLRMMANDLELQHSLKPYAQKSRKAADAPKSLQAQLAEANRGLEILRSDMHAYIKEALESKEAQLQTLAANGTLVEQLAEAQKQLVAGQNRIEVLQKQRAELKEALAAKDTEIAEQEQVLHYCEEKLMRKGEHSLPESVDNWVKEAAAKDQEIERLCQEVVKANAYINQADKEIERLNKCCERLASSFDKERELLRDCVMLLQDCDVYIGHVINRSRVKALLARAAELGVGKETK